MAALADYKDCKFEELEELEKIVEGDIKAGECRHCFSQIEERACTFIRATLSSLAKQEEERYCRIEDP